MALYSNLKLPDLPVRRVQPPAPTTPPTAGAGVIEPLPCGLFQLRIKGLPSGVYPTKAKARSGLAIYKRMGVAS